MTCFMWSGTQCLNSDGFLPLPLMTGPCVQMIYHCVWSLLQEGGLNGFMHCFLAEVMALCPFPLMTGPCVQMIYHCVWSLCYRRAVWTGSCTVSWPRWWQSVGHTCRHWAAMLWSHFSWLSASLKTTYTRTRWSSESYSTSLLEVTFSLAYRLLENLLRLPCAKNYYPLCRMGALSDTAICLPVCLSVCLSVPA